MLAARGMFQESLEQLTDALRLRGDAPTAEHAATLAYLGQCYCESGDLSEGTRILSIAIGTAQSQAGLIYEAAPRVFLANAMLDLMRPRDAEWHLRIALQLDRQLSTGPSEADQMLHLLGEALKMQRRHREAHRIFLELQQRFYPEDEGLADVLMDGNARERIKLLS